MTSIRPLIRLSLFAGLFAVAGCMESATLLKVEKDGSGTITHRMYLSGDMEEMMKGMAGGMMAEQGGGDIPAFDLLGSVRESLDGQFGPAATLNETKDVTNTAGWKGLEAKYSFEDVTKLDMTAKANDAGPGMQPNGPSFRFEFTPGEVATLKVVADVPEGQADAGDAPGTGADTAVAPETVDLGGMGLGMMAPMLKGMRMSFLVAVQGSVVESNATYPHKQHPNVATLADIRMDAVLEHPEGRKLLQPGANPAPADLAALDTEGVRIQDPDQDLVITFQ